MSKRVEHDDIITKFEQFLTSKNITDVKYSMPKLLQMGNMVVIITGDRHLLTIAFADYIESIKDMRFIYAQQNDMFCTFVATIYGTIRPRLELVSMFDNTRLRLLKRDGKVIDEYNVLKKIKVDRDGFVSLRFVD